MIDKKAKCKYWNDLNGKDLEDSSVELFNVLENSLIDL